MTTAHQTDHTPGPWRVEADEWVGLEIHSNNHGQVADVLALPGVDPARPLANARLIAAAPELFELLDTIVSEIDADASIHGTTVQKAATLLRRIERGR